jgi:hypothetical protein
MQNHENNNGTKAGEGPDAKGLIHGKTMKMVIAHAQNFDVPNIRRISGKSRFTVNSQLVAESLSWESIVKM